MRQILMKTYQKDSCAHFVSLTVPEAVNILPPFQRPSFQFYRSTLKESLEGMPNHKSAEKRDRQSKKRNLINSANRTRLRTQIKKLRAAIAEGNTTDAQALLPVTVSALDKSIQKGILKRNTAARHKSRLTQHVNAMAAK